ncbi:hypothetical protein [Priestia megaterium]|uniref:hypothetical protein n=1 Tax=Priestia megaterium TaxID=1404 RepID=UPI00196A80F8|nr:hypothetical protein [Priestia megaterium]QSF41314.1 hypothetical protein ICR96_11855 [Priestia megaterium]
MSYYDKKVIKGSCKKEESWKKEDHSKDDYCKKDYFCDDYQEDECACEEIAGSVGTGAIITVTVTTAPLPLPLTTPLFLSECMGVDPSGGIVIEEDGEYFVQFTAGLITALTGTLQVFAGTRFLGNAGNGTALSTARFAQIVSLKKGDVVRVVTTATITLGLANAAILTVAKVGD